MTEQTIGRMFGSGGATTFMGLPACRDLSTVAADAVIVGAPSATPYASVGAYCAEAPGVIRAAMAHYATTLGHYDFDLLGPLLGEGGRVVDAGDLDHGSDAAANRALIREAVGHILDRGAVPIVIGGDDSIPIPLFEAFKGRGRYTILQIDAHIDWRDEVDGERLGLSSTMRRAHEMGHFERIIQVGQRAAGSARPSDIIDARAAGVTFIGAREVHARGIAPVLDLIAPGAEVLIAFDCDALDPAVMPAVIGRAPGGLTYWQVVDLLHGVAERARIAAFDLVEFMPSRDIGGQGALVAGRILANVVGLLARQHTTRSSGSADSGSGAPSVTT